MTKAEDQTITFYVGKERRKVIAHDGDTVTIPRDDDGFYLEWEPLPAGGGGSNAPVQP